MSGQRPLADRLERLAAAGFGDAGGRMLRASGTEPLLRAILFEADTIVMPREMRLEGRAGRGLALEVANRRILRARALGGAEPVALDQADPETPETVRRMILAMLGDETAARVEHLPLGRAIDPAEPGISVRVIAEAWDVPLEAPAAAEDGEILDGFLSVATEMLPAWLMVSGEVSESFGDEDLLDGLIALGEGPLARAIVARKGGERWRFAAAGPFVDEAPWRAVAALGGTLFVMAIAPGQLGAVCEHWRRALD